MIRILTDDGADLSFSLREKYKIEVLPIGLTDGENEFESGRSIEMETFFENMRNGVQYVTSRVSTASLEAAFTEAVSAGDTVIYISLSSELSGSFEGAEVVKRQMGDKGNNIYLVDSKTATFGEGVLAVKAAILRDEGKSVEEIVAYLEDIKMTSFEFFTVGGLEYLHRGGRVSKATKIASGVLQLSPILEANKESGKLQVLDVYRGQKGLLKKLKAYMNAHSEGGTFDPNQTVFVYAGDWDDRVAAVKRFLIEEMGVKEENVNTELNVGAIISAHTGPEVVIVTFSGKPDRLSII